MHLAKTAILTAGAAMVAALVVVALMLASGNSGETPRAQADTGPTPTEISPKPGTDGSLSGVYDLLIAGGTPAVPDKNLGLFHCIARVDHDAGTDDVKAALQCYIDTPGQQAGSPLVDGADLVPGPPPPPPYGTGAPMKAIGTYDSGTDTLSLTACFSNAGGNLGPNIIAEVTVADAKADLAANGIMNAAVIINTNQSIKDCDFLSPQGTAPDPVPANFYLAGHVSGQ